MTISEQILLEKCRKIEMYCAELYQYFTGLFSDNEQAAALFSKTALEEEGHAEQFTFALKLKKQLPCMVVADIKRVDSIVSQLQEVISRVKVSPPTLVSALTSSIKLEKHLYEFHVHMVVMFENQQNMKMFQAMMNHDQDHIGSLQAYLDFLNGDQEWTFSA